jgi:hypothetical protein
VPPGADERLDEALDDDRSFDRTRGPQIRSQPGAVQTESGQLDALSITVSRTPSICPTERCCCNSTRTP